MSSSRRRGPFFLVGTACCPVASLGSLAPLSPRAFAGFAAPGALSIPRPRRRQPHRHRRLLLVLEISGAASSSWSAADSMLRISVGHANRIASRHRRLPLRVPLASALPTPALSLSRSGREQFFASVRDRRSDRSGLRHARRVQGHCPLPLSPKNSRRWSQWSTGSRSAASAAPGSDTGVNFVSCLCPLARRSRFPSGRAIGSRAAPVRGSLPRPLSNAARAPSLRSAGAPNRPWCAPPFSLISTPGGVFSHTRRISDALPCKRALARHYTASIAENQHPVVPGKVTPIGGVPIPLIYNGLFHRDVTADTPVHGGWPIVTTVLRPRHHFGICAGRHPMLMAKIHGRCM